MTQRKIYGCEHGYRAWLLPIGGVDKALLCRECWQRIQGIVLAEILRNAAEGAGTVQIDLKWVPLSEDWQ